jgi:hypothetical protein
LGSPFAPVNSLARTLVRDAQADPDRRAWHQTQAVSPFASSAAIQIAVDSAATNRHLDKAK